MKTYTTPMPSPLLCKVDIQWLSAEWLNNEWGNGRKEPPSSGKERRVEWTKLHCSWSWSGCLAWGLRQELSWQSFLGMHISLIISIFENQIFSHFPRPQAFILFFRILEFYHHVLIYHEKWTHGFKVLTVLCENSWWCFRVMYCREEPGAHAG